MKLIDMVQGNATFIKYFDGDLWYSISFYDSEADENDTFQFPVPVSDLGNATMLPEDKALYLLRYIRKHIAVITNT